MFSIPFTLFTAVSNKSAKHWTFCKGAHTLVLQFVGYFPLSFPLLTKTCKLLQFSAIWKFLVGCSFSEAGYGNERDFFHITLLMCELRTKFMLDMLLCYSNLWLLCCLMNKWGFELAVCNLVGFHSCVGEWWTHSNESSDE